jgi:hypothetical protein
MKLTLTRLIVTLFLIVNFCAPAIAGPLEDAAAAYGKGDYATAVKLL